MTYAVDAESFMKLGVRTKKGRDAESKRCLGSYNAAHCRKRVYGEIRKRKSCKAATKACRHRSIDSTVQVCLSDPKPPLPKIYKQPPEPSLHPTYTESR